MSKIDFSLWLQEQISTREWKPTDLAKRSRISDTAVSRILRGERKPDTDTLLSFAHALNVSPITITSVVTTDSIYGKLVDDDVRTIIAAL